MKFLLCCVFLILGVVRVEPFDNLNFLRSGLRWITDKVGSASENHGEEIINRTVEEISNVGNLLKLPLNLNSLVTEGLALQTLEITRHGGSRSGSNTSAEGQTHLINKTKKRTNLLELAKSLNLTVLVQKIEDAGIEDVLDHEGPFTLFAPTNEAFGRTPKYCGNVDPKDLMKYHVGRGAVTSDHFKNNLIVNALLTRRGIRINKYQDDKVITANGRLIAHVDYTASNGILHVLDNVMCALYKGSVIVQINRCPSFSLLAHVVNTTDLYSLFNGPSPVTIFAPTDSAFKKLPPDVLNNLLKNVTALKEVILFHAVPNVWYSHGFQNGDRLKSIQGQTLTISISGKNVEVNNAQVTIADATAENGVVHSIDTVLLPKTVSQHVQFNNPIVKLI